MFDPNRIVIDAFEENVISAYLRAFADPDPQHVAVLREVVRVVLDMLVTTDAPYHDMTHTILVTLVGQEIVAGRRSAHGDVTSSDWVHFVASTLCHDIGYVRGVCRGDRGGSYSPGTPGDALIPPPGATDAWMNPWHVDRGKQFVQERFAGHTVLDPAVLAGNIELTRFPVPSDPAFAETDTFAGLVRAADLIGQLADPMYVRKMSRLFAEFRETGEADRLGYDNAAHLRSAYPGFFWNVVRPYIDDGLRHLQRSANGREWVANLYAHVFAEEHEEPAFGPERRDCTDRRQRGSRLPEGTDRRESRRGRRSADQPASRSIPPAIVPTSIATRSV